MFPRLLIYVVIPYPPKICLRANKPRCCCCNLRKKSEPHAPGFLGNPAIWALISIRQTSDGAGWKNTCRYMYYTTADEQTIKLHLELSVPHLKMWSSAERDLHTPPDMVPRDLHPATKLHSHFNASATRSAIVSGEQVCQ